jgi:hypothetical protein
VGVRVGSTYHLAVGDTATFSFRPGIPDVVAYCGDGRTIAEIEDAFESVVVPLTAHAAGLQVLHASAVDAPTGVVLFCARSGTGKTTLAYGLHRRSGFPLWADDAVAIDPAADAPEAVRLPGRRLNLRDATLKNLGAPSGEELVDAAPGERRPVAAVVLLERAGGVAGPELTRLAPAPSLEALLPHAYRIGMDAPGRKRQIVGEYLSLTAQVPVWQLRFRPDFGHFDALLDAVAAVARKGRP